MRRGRNRRGRLKATSAGRHNQLLRGLPQQVEAFEKAGRGRDGDGGCAACGICQVEAETSAQRLVVSVVSRSKTTYGVNLIDQARATAYTNGMPTIENLRQAVVIAEQIEKLQAELNALLQGAPAPVAPAKTPAVAAPKPAAKKKGKMSATGRAAIVAAQKARWAKINEAKAAKAAPAKAAKPVKKKRNVSPKVRAKFAAMMKARWAAKKAGAAAPASKKKK